MMFRASAPGKLVLLGEYAVLEGAPALVMAVDRRAVAELVPVQSRKGSVYAPDMWPHRESFTVGADGGPLWDNRDPRLADAMSLVTCVMHTFLSSHQSDAMLFDLRLHSASFFGFSNGNRAKLGLGSSAAVTTALASVLAARAGRFDMLINRHDWLAELLPIHRMFQRGQGSGLDIAAAVYGGMVRYETHPDLRIRPLQWPSGLSRLWIWSGHSASTADFLANFERWKKDRPDECSGHMFRLAEIAERGSQAAAQGDGDSLLQCISEAAAALRAFGDASRIPVFSTRHRKIDELVNAAGGVYKPCGAGGGDLGMAAAKDAEIADRIKAALQSEGYAVLELDMDETGLSLDQLPENV